ncbi:Hypothetical_protein [Hexamita inflata]|uniref:Hypothetical_protein n=1 Tax=Hexamita inflata TaxID=28002 RepID=A0AA86QB71_9EUKA|nr:Hypothetical protein HINF_LOCUS43446 [Hexamita inflata]
MNQDEMIQKVIKEEYEQAQIKAKKNSKEKKQTPEKIVMEKETNNTPLKSKSKKVAKSPVIQEDIQYDEESEKPDMKKLRAKAKKICKAYEDLPSEDLVQFEFSSSDSDNTKKKLAELKAKTKRKSPAELIEYHTKIYKESLAFMKLDLTEATPKDLCKIIDNLDKYTYSGFWFGLVNRNLPEKNISHYRNYYKSSYRRVAFTEKLSEEEKKFLLELLETQKENMSLNQMTQHAFDTKLKNRDIFPQDVQNFLGKHLYQANKEIYRMPVHKDSEMKIFMLEMKIKEEEQAYYSNLYKQALQQVQSGKNSMQSAVDVCIQINELNPDQNSAFWDFIVENDKNKIDRTTQKNNYQKYQEIVCSRYNVNRDMNMFWDGKRY